MRIDKTGIYIIYWNDPKNCYIGQSHYIETRLRKHKEMLLSNYHYNYKLSNAYLKYGNLPIMEILEECSISDLDKLEIFYIREFDSINSGYNITQGGASPGGTEATRSKYTREELVEIFLLLTDKSLTNKDIVEITKKPYSLISAIAYNARHKWLSEEFPEKRKEIDTIIDLNLRSSLCNDYNARNGVVYNVIDPMGKYHSFSNIRQFALQNNLNPSHLNQVILGHEQQHKGWRKGVLNVI